MTKNRKELLISLLKKIQDVAKEVHVGQSFPFGDLMLGPQQVMILFFIAEKKSGISAKDLAKSTGVTPGAITQIIDTLAEKKLVKREENSQDRRMLSIKLTPFAEKEFSNFQKQYFISASRIFDNFSINDIEAFYLLIQKMKRPTARRKNSSTW